MRTWRSVRSTVGLIGVVAGVAMVASGCLAVGPQTSMAAGTFARAANDDGLIVGSRWLTSPVSVADHAFSYDLATGTTTSLGSLGGEASSALAVNDAGKIVGWATLASGQRRAFRYTSATGMTSIGVLAPAATTPSSTARGINATGTIVGESNLETGATDATHAFSYDPGSGTMTDLGTLGGTSSGATGVNDAGLVVGWSDVAGDASAHAFVYDPATAVMTDLGTFGGTSSRATDINDHDQVVGSFETGEVAPECQGLGCPLSRAFAYDLGSHVTTVFGVPAGYNSASASAINDDGVVVGSAVLYTIVCSHCGFPTQATAWELGTTGMYAIADGQQFASDITDGGLTVGTTYDSSAPFVVIPSGVFSRVTKVPAA